MGEGVSEGGRKSEWGREEVRDGGRMSGGGSE